jgi:hypothetical protein
LAVATLPDSLIAGLSQHAARVELFVASATWPAGSGSPREFWCDGAPYDPQVLDLLGSGIRLEQLDAAAYDAVVFPHGAMFSAGFETVLSWMRAAERLLRPGGVLAFKAETVGHASPHPRFFDSGLVRADGLAAKLRELTCFSVHGGFDPHVSKRTIDRVASDAGGVNGDGLFLARMDDEVMIPAVWFLTREDGVREARWEALREWLWARRFGEQIAALQIGTAGSRDERGSIRTLPRREGHVFYGPYLPAPAGRCQATLGFSARRMLRRRSISRAVLEAVVDGAAVATRRIDRAAVRTGSLEVAFDVVPKRDCTTASLEFRLYTPDDLALTITSLDVQWRQSGRATPWPELPGSGVKVGRASPAGTEAATEADSAAGPVSSNAERMVDVAPGQACRGGGHAGAAAVTVEMMDPQHGAPEPLGALGFPELSPAADAGSRPLSRLAAVEDWSDPAWTRYLDPLFSAPRPSAAGPHDPGLWERTHVLFGLAGNGKLTEAARVLVAATMPDELVATLSELVGQVDLVDLGPSSTRRGPEARLYWTNGALYARDRLTVHDAPVKLTDLAPHAYDAVIFPHCSLFRDGVSGMAGMIATAERLLGDGGLLVFKAEILAGGEPDIKHLDAKMVLDEGLAAQIEESTGFIVEGGFDARISALTARDVPPEGRLLQTVSGRVAVPSLWFLAKRRQTPEGGWRPLREWQVRRLMGEQLARLIVGPAGRRDDRGGIVSDPARRGVVFFGPYLGLPNGRYEVVIGLEAAPAGARGRLALDVVGSGGGRLAAREVRLAPGTASSVRLPFAVSQPGDEVLPVEFRMLSSGGAVTVTECRLLEAAG